jgi:hypothetical protein
MGSFWLLLIFLLEFVFGHYEMGHSSEALRAHYNIFTGKNTGSHAHNQFSCTFAGRLI